MSGIAMLNASFGAAVPAVLVMNLDAAAQGAIPGASITTSANFNGSTQRLSTTGGVGTTATTGTNMGTGSFTWECWVRATATTDYGTFIDTIGIDTGYSAVDTDGAYFGLDSGTLYPVYIANGATLITSSIAVTLNAWTHVAVVRNSGTTTLYVGGVSGGTYAESFDLSAPWVTIGGFAGVGGELAGQISNLRMVKGTAVYTSGFTPPTVTLRAVTGTQLLLPLSATPFMDMSTNLYTITNTGTTTTTASAPALTAATTDVTGTYALTTVNAGSLSWATTNGGIFSKSNSTGTDVIYGGPNYVTGQSYSVFMAYQRTATSAGRLLNTQSEASKDWLMGLYNGNPDTFYPNFSVNLPGSGADLIWHFGWATWNTTTGRGQLYTATSTQPTSVAFTAINAGGGGFNQLRLFSRSGGSEVQTGNIGMIRVYTGVLTLANVQSLYATFKARFGY